MTHQNNLQVGRTATTGSVEISIEIKVEVERDMNGNPGRNRGHTKTLLPL
jgi:hypothetical protein